MFGTKFIAKLSLEKMMKPEIPTINGDECDALSRWKNKHSWKAGDRRKIKQKYNRRVRKQIKEVVWNEVNDLLDNEDVLIYDESKELEQ